MAMDRGGRLAEALFASKGDMIDGWTGWKRHYILLFEKNVCGDDL
jgi:hypothetical protein